MPVVEGASQGFTITPTGGSTIADVLVDGVSVGPVAGYTFPGVAADHTIAASFASEPVAVEDLLPTELALWSPAPNPGLADWLLRFALPREAPVRLEIIDIAGRRLWLVEETLPAGTHSRHWDGADVHGQRVGSGIYFVRLGTPFGVRFVRGVMLR